MTGRRQETTIETFALSRANKNDRVGGRAARQKPPVARTSNVPSVARSIPTASAELDRAAVFSYVEFGDFAAEQGLGDPRSQNAPSVPRRDSSSPQAYRKNANKMMIGIGTPRSHKRIPRPMDISLIKPAG